MPTRLPWEPRFGVGHELVDAQHREMLDQCNRLADLCAGGDEADRQFDQAFEQLRTLARAHFEVEVALLAERERPLTLAQLERTLADLERAGVVSSDYDEACGERAWRLATLRRRVGAASVT